MNKKRDVVPVIGLKVNVATYESALAACLNLARRNQPASVSAANTHIASAARHSQVFGRVMAAFDLILPDGMPLIWVMNARLRRMGRPTLGDRVYGPYFMRHAILHSPPETTHYFFGGSQECLDELCAAARKMRPDITIAGMLSPPYRAWGEEDQQDFARQINQASPDFVWVALGGEKQETWIVENLHRYNRGVFFAIGDAFELLAGRRPFAPELFQRLGITWLYRLLQEPGRMWKRYLKYNSLFLRYLVYDALTRNRCGSVARPNEEGASAGVVKRVNVLGVGVSAINMQSAAEILLAARREGASGYVCVTGVHGVIESQRNPELKIIHNNSFLTVPDGMPTVWMGREQGFTRMGRVYGPDLMLKIMESTASGTSGGLTHFLCGATDDMLQKLKSNLESRFPGVRIVGTYAPPFRPLNEQEEAELRGMVEACKPDFFWVGLSTPKQERFMAGHADNPGFGIMLGVGAAFPIHAGLQKDSPEWIKNSGLQWFHRLCKEPRRLWRRYLDIVPKFIWLAAMQVLGIKRYELQRDLSGQDG
jgi:N-acetylglucosaminyldiphosphoundecaprenol N-acetyl-beta-D-mannosaminyltransferase